MLSQIQFTNLAGGMALFLIAAVPIRAAESAQKGPAESDFSKKAETSVAADPVSPEAATLNKAKESAFRSGDLASGIVFLHELIATDSSAAGQVRWKSELIQGYLFQGNLRGASVVWTDLSQSNPEVKESLEGRVLAGTIEEAFGRKAEALETWQEIVKMPQATSLHGVRLAGLYIDNGRFDEAASLIAELRDKKEDRTGMVVVVNTASDRQQVPIEAALYNLDAVVSLNREPADVKSATASLEKALSVAPDFYSAKQNLEALQKAANPESAAPEKPVK